MLISTLKLAVDVDYKGKKVVINILVDPPMYLPLTCLFLVNINTPKILWSPSGPQRDVGPSVLRATSGLAEQLRETTIFGIFPYFLSCLVLGTLLAFTSEGIVVGF